MADFSDSIIILMKGDIEGNIALAILDNIFDLLFYPRDVKNNVAISSVLRSSIHKVSPLQSRDAVVYSKKKHAWTVQGPGLNLLVQQVVGHLVDCNNLLSGICSRMK